MRNKNNLKVDRCHKRNDKESREITRTRTLEGTLAHEEVLRKIKVRNLDAKRGKLNNI